MIQGVAHECLGYSIPVVNSCLCVVAVGFAGQVPIGIILHLMSNTVNGRSHSIGSRITYLGKKLLGCVIESSLVSHRSIVSYI